MRTRYIAALAVAAALLVAGTALAFTLNARTGPADASAMTVVETDNCCLSGDCCCPLQGACCDPNARASAPANVKYVKKGGAGCCVTGERCCPPQGACCAAPEAKKDSKPFVCPVTGEELACPNCCPLNKAQP